MSSLDPQIDQGLSKQELIELLNQAYTEQQGLKAQINVLKLECARQKRQLPNNKDKIIQDLSEIISQLLDLNEGKLATKIGQISDWIVRN